MKPLAILVVSAYACFFSYLYGRSVEAELTLDAYQVAREYQIIANVYQTRAARLFGISEQTVRTCILQEDE